jgi:glutamate dehydrogenase/leucine dehydrogenase
MFVMESLLKEWNGETVIINYDHPTGAWIFIAIHSTKLGPVGGGTRMRPYPDVQSALQDSLRLAEAMSYKWAISGMDFGGGKAVIAIPPDFDQQSRQALLRRYGAMIRKLGGLFNTGPDVGTSSSDMDIIAETGSPYVFGRTPAAGGFGSSGPATALGVFSGMQIACEHVFGERSLNGRRVLVQGAGSVGGALIEYLHTAGAEVQFSDVGEDAICRFRDDFGLHCIPSDDVYSAECDILSPCALGGVLNDTTIPQLKCRIVAGGANNQLAKLENAEHLKDRGILYAPDYVINGGGVMFIVGMGIQNWTKEQMEKEVTEKIQNVLQQIFKWSATEGITTEAAARQIAEKRLSSDT